MWTPRANVMDEAEIRPMVEQIGAAELVTVGGDGFPVATRLPLIWAGDRLVFHMAVANPQWKTIADGARALAVVTGADAYITPTWYAAKAEHGRVVPTWNYSAVHFTGRATVHRDPQWLLDAVSDLSDLHEQSRAAPWAVSDAPEVFIAQQLGAIVGIELVIDSVDAKAKRSQNRSDEDRRTVAEGLREQGGSREHAVADQMDGDLAGSSPRDSRPARRAR